MTNFNFHKFIVNEFIPIFNEFNKKYIPYKKYQIQNQKLREFNAIIQYYEGEIKKDPKNLGLILAVAEVYYSLKNYSQAVEYYKRALALDPENLKIKIFHVAGVFYLKRGADYEKK